MYVGMYLPHVPTYTIERWRRFRLVRIWWIRTRHCFGYRVYGAPENFRVQPKFST